MSDLRILITLGNAEAIALAVQEGIGVGIRFQDGGRPVVRAKGGDGAGARHEYLPGNLYRAHTSPSGYLSPDCILEFRAARKITLEPA